MTIITLSNYHCPKCGANLAFEGREISFTSCGQVVTDAYRCTVCQAVKKLTRSEEELTAEYVRLEVDRLIAESPYQVSETTRERLIAETGGYFERKAEIQRLFTRDQSFLSQDFYKRAREIIVEADGGNSLKD